MKNWPIVSIELHFLSWIIIPKPKFGSSPTRPYKKFSWLCFSLIFDWELSLDVIEKNRKLIWMEGYEAAKKELMGKDGSSRS